MDDGGSFGRWATDSDGLPCFDMDVSRLQSRGLVLPEDDARRMWHQVGNDRVTATAHAGGWTTLYSAEEGFVRLSGTDPSRAEGLGGTWALRDSSGSEILSPFTPGVKLGVRWGTGYAEWVAEGEGASLRRRVWAPFGDVPAVRIDVCIDPGGGVILPGSTLSEHWGFVPYPLFPGGLMSRRVPAPSAYGTVEKLAWHAFFTASTLSRELTEMIRRIIGSRIAIRVKYVPELDAILMIPQRRRERTASGTRPSVLPRVPGVIFFALLREGVERRDAVEQYFESGNGYARARFSVQLGAGEGVQEHSFAAGFACRKEIPWILHGLRTASRTDTAASWRGVADLDMVGAPAVEREATWHAYYLRSAGVRDSYFSCRYVPQGSAYGFIQGGQGAPRDYAISCIPLVYLDPPLAKDILRLIMRMTRPDGAIYYAHAGAGQCSSALVHGAPTDLPLFFLWALTEYVWATGDSGFLDESVPFWSGRYGRRREGTVRERVLLAWHRIRDGVGLGPHGMLRVGSGDWNDPISLMAPDAIAFHREGESAFNTAFAVYALPRAARLLSPTHPQEAASVDAYAARLREAMERAWCGRWFLRGWDGKGGPIGDEHLFLDAQVWCLIARIGAEEQRRTLVDAIAKACDDPSPIGATILDQPHPVRLGMLPPGWDCNGGVWGAINGLLAWAYSLHDPGLAWRSLEKQSLAAHGRAYPDVWYGIWSGPDSYNAHYAERPGEAFVHPATPMAEFPVMNSNAHAGPLLALLKVLGVEATPNGVTVTPGLPEGVGPWRLSTALLDAESDGEHVRVKRKRSLSETSHVAKKRTF